MHGFKLDSNKQEIFDLYYRQKKRLSKIAEKYNVSERTVRNSINRWNWKNRGHIYRPLTETQKQALINSNKRRRGKPFLNWGGKNPEETKKKIAEKTRIRMTGSKLSLETRKKLSLLHKGVPKSEAHKRKLSQSLKGRKHSPERIKAIINGFVSCKIQTKMTAPEKIVNNFLYSYCNSWKYTGNKTFWLNFKDGSYKNPDFINKYTKKAIEVFGNYWHKNDNPEELIKKYKEINWDCLVLWENQIKEGHIIDIFESWAYPREYYGD